MCVLFRGVYFCSLPVGRVPRSNYTPRSKIKPVRGYLWEGKVGRGASSDSNDAQSLFKNVFNILKHLQNHSGLILIKATLQCVKTPVIPCTSY